MTPKTPLRKVEYSRKYQAEHASTIHLVGNSRWLSDLELLLEEQWSGLRTFETEREALTALTNDAPALILVEPNPFGLDPFRWIDSAPQANAKAILIAQDSIDRFTWARLTRRAANGDVASILLSSDAQHASGELSEIMDSTLARQLAQDSELETVHSAYNGFLVAAPVTENLAAEIFKFLAHEFILPSRDLKRGLALVETWELWKRPKPSESDIALAYRRIERALKNTDAEKLLRCSELAHDSYRRADLTEEKWGELLSTVGFGMLARRKLTKQYSALVTALQLANNTKILRIA